MAENSTIYKANLNISDMDRNIFSDYSLILAKHPSENEQRLMIRLLAFVLYFDETLAFGKGLGHQEEPTLWVKDLTDDILLWIDIGLPDEKNIRKACGRSKKVVLIMYGRGSEQWWIKNEKDCSKKKNLTVIQLDHHELPALAGLAERNMDLTFTLDGGQVSIFSGETSIDMHPTQLHPLL